MKLCFIIAIIVTNKKLSTQKADPQNVHRIQICLFGYIFIKFDNLDENKWSIYNQVKV